MESNVQIRDVQLSPSSSSSHFMKTSTWISDDTRGKVPNCCQFFLSTPHTAVVIHIVMLLNVDDQHRFSASPSLHRSSRFQSSEARSYQHQIRARGRVKTDQNENSPNRNMAPPAEGRRSSTINSMLGERSGTSTPKSLAAPMTSVPQSCKHQS